MTLTLAIPYHSGPDLLERALASAVAQDDRDWILYVCDDSPDGSGEAPTLAVKDPRVHYVRNPKPAGMVANWMFCLAQAQTPWVTLLHADDELMPSYVRTMRRLASEHPDAALLYCQAIVIGPDGAPIFSLPDYVKGWIDPSGGGDLVIRGEDGAASLLRGSFIMCPTCCYRADVLRAHGFSADWRQVQDLDLYLRLLEAGLKLVGSAERAYRYRRHPNNATASQTRDMSRFREEIALYRATAARFASRGWTQAAQVGAKMRILKLHIAFRVLEDLLGLRLKPAQAKARLLWETIWALP